MPGSEAPKLIYAFSRARIYSDTKGGVILFWRRTPVACFPELETAIKYVYAEFEGPNKGDSWRLS